MSGQLSTFSGFRWTSPHSSTNATTRSRMAALFKAVDWEALVKLARDTRNGVDCELLPDIGVGYNHMVRVLRFKDEFRLLARTRLPCLADAQDNLDLDAVTSAVMSEVQTMIAIAQNTHVPVPKIYAFETRADCKVGAPFILMDCLEGNVGTDLSVEIPSEHKQGFFREMAKIQIGLSQIQSPKIGKIIGVSENGFELGPIPGIGGPFNTAAEFYKAWAENVVFDTKNDRLRKTSGVYAEEVQASITTFQATVGRLADKISLRNEGPFPLFHGDFGHHNIVVDDNYHINGLIDFEFSFACPWEMISIFPLHLMTMPSAIDAPWNYDSDGNAVPVYLADMLEDQKAYLKAVELEEMEQNNTSAFSLSEAMRDAPRQQFATAIWFFQESKPGFYAKLIEKYSSAWQVGDEK
ncbi:hypothetical protein QM012_003614 [Aureobasidium pullulans]|uniref:Aminoglycoside phosphotransferase domain-containing protein n=1 Tax=Aureobasidium pullulans TaxID=5580 RepID=A0ABR0T7G4_AURPU